uniref:Nuclear receptor domain-containing protein n=1 Tax=Rhabditophanes sp. KR3021 TaxID=114890 RepID=A0AC35TGM3_9BILA
MVKDEGKKVVEEDDDECLCCGFKGKQVGVHFQVNSCRGCAGFYKRSITLGLQFRCRRGNYSCEIKAGTKMCRYCRLAKAKKAGMTLRTKINENTKEKYEEAKVVAPTTDSSPVSSNKSISFGIDNERLGSVVQSPPSTSALLSPSQTMVSTTPEGQTSIDYKALQTNFTKTVNEIKAIIAGPYINVILYNPNFNPTCLQRMTICLQQYFPKWGMKAKEEFIVNEPVAFKDFVKFRKKGFTMYAELLMSIPEFAGLGYDEKILIFRIFWPRFGHLCSVQHALQIFGSEGSNCMFLVNEDQAFSIEANNNEYPSNFFADLGEDKNSIMKPSFSFFINNLYRPLKKLKLDQIEFSFLILQVLWSHKKRDGLSENTIFVMEKILQLASTELHNYYVYEKGLDNYSWRLVEITKLLAESTQYAIMMREVMLMIKIFGLFDVSFIDNEISALI